MLKDEFLAMIIAELSRQKEEDEQGFMTPHEKRALKIFNTMCYDFPEVSSDELLRLATAIDDMAKQAIESVARDTKTNQTSLNAIDDEFASKFYLNRKFIENVIFLSSNVAGKTISSATEIATNVGQRKLHSLPSSVFLSLPHMMLGCNRPRLTMFFLDEMILHDDGSHVSHVINKLLPWNEIVTRFETFLLMISSSVILADTAGDTFIRAGYFDSLLSMIRMLRLSDVNGSIEDDTLLCEVKKSRRTEVSSLVSQAKSEGKDHEEGEDEDGYELTVGKRLWVHLVLLAKDLMLQLPAALPTYMQTLLDMIVDPTVVIPLCVDEHAYLFAPKTYPTSEECMFVLVVSHASASQVVTSSMARSNTRGTKGVTSPEEASAGSFLIGTVTTLLNYVTSTLRRMLAYNDDDKNDEVLSMLCSICELCVSIDCPPGHPSLRPDVIERTRRRYKLLQAWERCSIFSILSDKVISVLFPRQIQLSIEQDIADSKDECLFSLSLPPSRSVSHARLTAIRVLSAAMLQSVPVAEQVLKLLRSKLSMTDLHKLYDGSMLSNLSGTLFAFFVGLSNVGSSSSTTGCIDSNVLGCFKAIAQRILLGGSGNDGPMGLITVAAGLQLSLDILLSELMGLCSLQALIGRHRDPTDTFLIEFRHLVDEIFDVLGSSKSRSTDGLEAEGVIDSRGAEVDTIELADGKFEHRHGKATDILNNQQKELLRLQLKKVKACLNQEPIGSDKTD